MLGVGKGAGEAKSGFPIWRIVGEGQRQPWPNISVRKGAQAAVAGVSMISVRLMRCSGVSSTGSRSRLRSRLGSVGGRSDITVIPSRSTVLEGGGTGEWKSNGLVVCDVWLFGGDGKEIGGLVSVCEKETVRSLGDRWPITILVSPFLHASYIYRGFRVPALLSAGESPFPPRQRIDRRRRRHPPARLHAAFPTSRFTCNKQ